MYPDFDFSGNESVLDRISVEDLENPDFDFAAIREDLGIVRADYENNEDDLPF